ncbi:helix-turn-helix domain-containing protein [Sphingosinicella sp.]|uniref:helix-turn-helix domain-containing protein n=1 Tax=Sphingosinicella sp. TaxID=1917971 RepID=UPI0035B40D9D
MSIDPAPHPITVRIPEACRITGIGRSKLYELIKAGDIPTIKVGSMTLVPIKGLEGFLEGVEKKVSG